MEEKLLRVQQAAVDAEGAMTNRVLAIQDRIQETMEKAMAAAVKKASSTFEVRMRRAMDVLDRKGGLLQLS